MCFKCFETGHMVKDCKSKIKCTAEGCESRDSYHSLMHKNASKNRSD